MRQPNGRSSFGRRLLATTIAFASLTLAGGAVAVPATAATLHVNCSTTNLQSKINAAPAGSTLLIRGVCDGNFVVDKNLTLKGDPSAILDGGNAGSVLTTPASRTVHLLNLTITGGVAQLGAGINRQGSGNGVLTLDHVTVSNNLASDPTVAEGGGILVEDGRLVLRASRVVDNRAIAQTAVGGGILANHGLTLLNSTVSFNRVTADNPGGGATAVGGGVFGGGGPLTVTSSHLDGNHATATASGQAVAVDGAMDWTSGPRIVVKGSTVNGNGLEAHAGTNSGIAVNGGLGLSSDTISISNTVLANNQVEATSTGSNAIAVTGGMTLNATDGSTVTGTRIVGSTVTAHGGIATTAVAGGMSTGGPTTLRSSRIAQNIVAAHADSGDANAVSGGLSADSTERLTVVSSTFDQNHLTARADAGTATATSGGLSGGDPLLVSRSTISRNTAKATALGANTANAVAGGILVGAAPTANLTNTTVANNIVRAESDPATGTANAIGGGIESLSDALTLVNTTVARNTAGAAAATRAVRGGGIRVQSGTTTLRATILGLNTASASGGPNCSGTVKSQGFNVLGTVSGCTFQDKPSDDTGVNPRLGALANNGGPTMTLALLNGSPALDNIPAASCAVAIDQRGVHRPQNNRCDTGAFERKVP